MMIISKLIEDFFRFFHVAYNFWQVFKGKSQEQGVNDNRLDDDGSLVGQTEVVLYTGGIEGDRSFVCQLLIAKLGNEDDLGISLIGKLDELMVLNRLCQCGKADQQIVFFHINIRF